MDARDTSGERLATGDTRLCDAVGVATLDARLTSEEDGDNDSDCETTPLALRARAHTSALKNSRIEEENVRVHAEAPKSKRDSSRVRGPSSDVGCASNH